ETATRWPGRRRSSSLSKPPTLAPTPSPSPPETADAPSAARREGKSAAVDHDALAVHVAAGVGDEEAHHRGHVLRTDHAPEGRERVEGADVIDPHRPLHQPAAHLG